jgi:hypothetical protein
MYADPQTITIDVTAHDLARIQSGTTKSIYANSDQTVKMTLSHQEQKNRVRHMARVDNVVVAADPLTAVNASQTLGVYIVIDEPSFGFEAADIDDVTQALIAWLTSANVLKLLSMQH